MDLVTKIQRQFAQSHPQHCLRLGGGAALFGCGDTRGWADGGAGALPCAAALFALELRDLSRVLRKLGPVLAVSFDQAFRGRQTGLAGARSSGADELGGFQHSQLKTSLARCKRATPTQSSPAACS
jgi:hypothetical protein